MVARETRWMVLLIGSLFAIGAMALVACGPAAGNKPGGENGASNKASGNHDTAPAGNGAGATNEHDHDHEHADDPHHEYLEHHMEDINAAMRTINRTKDAGFVKSNDLDPAAAGANLHRLFTELAASDAAKAKGDQFVTLANAAATAVNGLHEALKVQPAPNAAAVNAALGAVGGTCKGCHDLFRKD